jgi:hypothetical protein
VSRGSSLTSVRVAIVAALAVVAAFALVACGDESAEELTFELDGKGKAQKFSGPESAESGEAEITFTNNTDGEAEMQLIRVEGDHSAEDVVKGLEAATQGKPFPEWFFAGGGVSAIGSDESKTVTQVLEPGTYYATNLESGPPSADSMIAIEVSGDESDEELTADATVEASEYAFAADGLAEGENEVAFENVGAQPHHLIIAPITEDGTIEEVEEAITGKDGGEPPLDEDAPQLTTAVIEGGESQLVDFDLEPGKYAMLCFISDREGGPPHAVKGMIDELVIE